MALLPENIEQNYHRLEFLYIFSLGYKYFYALQAKMQMFSPVEIHLDFMSIILGTINQYALTVHVIFPKTHTFRKGILHHI